MLSEFGSNLPMQDHLSEGRLGNLIALPLQGQALKNGNSAFVDENWNAYADQWSILFGKPKYDREFVETKIKEWSQRCSIDEKKPADIFPESDEKPWDKTNRFFKVDIEGMLQITLADGVYVNSVNLTPRIQNHIRELAAFSNPKFYKNLAMGLANYSESRFIYLGNDENGYIKVPRGVLEVIIAKCEQAGIECHIEDKRNAGKKIKVRFCGELQEKQQEAADTMLRYDCGILNAATAFGKTVVCCNLIAQKKTNTLILIQSSTLMDQWRNALENFLIIDEDSPEYQTPSGMIKKRNSVIGRLQGAHDSTTGIIDIAMVGSIRKKGEGYGRLKEYGLVIVDECHHAASDTFVDVLQRVNAKYVYGVTATPFRGDGLQKMNTMLIGPIRFKYTAKERAQEQGIPHLVYPRFTRTVVPRLQQEQMHINDAYKILRSDSDRDEMIVNDVIDCISAGRTPVILSRYVDHTKRLYDRLSLCADHVFLLLGENSKKEHQRILEKMRQVKSEESMLLLATGNLVGEGFDFPRLDTLIMAMPVSGRQVVEQYAGRLNRDFPGKKDVVIYDYVDSHISKFDRMYHKRLKAYQQIAFEIYSGEENKKHRVDHSIFDMDSYSEVYCQDLQDASEEIIISSPKVSRKKAEEFIRMLCKKMEAGLRVILVTWDVDVYGYGDSGTRMAILEQLRQTGIEINLVQDFCEHFCIIDRQIVWYGSMNLLGEEEAEDNLMRVCSTKISTELLEMTFG